MTARDQQRTVPVELAQQVLGVGVTSSGKLFHFLGSLVPVGQRKGLVPDDLPQFPAEIGLAPHLLWFVMPSQVSVLERNLPQVDALRLPDDGVFDLPELFLLRQLFLLSWLVVVVAVYLALEGAPLVVALTHYR